MTALWQLWQNSRNFYPLYKRLVPLCLVPFSQKSCSIFPKVLFHLLLFHFSKSLVPFLCNRVDSKGGSLLKATRVAENLLYSQSNFLTFHFISHHHLRKTLKKKKKHFFAKKKNYREKCILKSNFLTFDFILQCHICMKQQI